jgi:hypothetical protein
MSFGGVNLFKDGQHITSAGSSVHYKNLDFKHVQGLWRIFALPDVQTKVAELNKILSEKLVLLGDQFGIEQGKMSATDLQEIKRLFGQ